jgi:hypothetical protein
VTMRFVLLSTLLALAALAHGCAEHQAPAAPPRSAPQDAGRTWQLDDERQLSGFVDGNDCWVRPKLGRGSQSLSLRYDAAVCRSAGPPDWTAVRGARSDAGDVANELMTPVWFLLPPDGIVVARRLLELEQRAHPELRHTLSHRGAAWALALYGPDGQRDLAGTAALCDAGNPVACMAGADAANWIGRAERACRLGWPPPCDTVAMRRLGAFSQVAQKLPELASYQAAHCEHCTGSAAGELARACTGFDRVVFGPLECAPPSGALAEPAAARIAGRTPLQIAGPDPDAEAAERLRQRRDVLHAAARATAEFGALHTWLCGPGKDVARGLSTTALREGIDCEARRATGNSQTLE